MYLYTALPWRKALRLGPWPRPGLERSVRALGVLSVGALRPYVCITLAEARLLVSCLVQPYEAGPAEPTVGLLTSGLIGWRSKVAITALVGKLFDKLFA